MLCKINIDFREKRINAKKRKKNKLKTAFLDGLFYTFAPFNRKNQVIIRLLINM